MVIPKAMIFRFHYYSKGVVPQFMINKIVNHHLLIQFLKNYNSKTMV